MKVVVLKKSQRSRPGVCPWLIDAPTETTQKK